MRTLQQTTPARAAIASRGWTFKSIADKRGVSRQTIVSAIDNPNHNHGRAHKRYLAKALGISMDELWPVPSFNTQGKSA